MSRFDEILNKIDEANYRDDEREFDRDSCEKIIKDAEILATAAKELKIRLKQDDYKACASILKKWLSMLIVLRQTLEGLPSIRITLFSFKNG